MNTTDNTLIESAAYGGKGVTRIDGRVYFVPQTLPGDRIKLKITRDHGRYVDAEVVEFIERAAVFQTSPCNFSAECGGCQWLEATYEAQLKWKLNFVESALARVGKLPPTVSLKIVPSTKQFHYRNRVHVKGVIDDNGQVKLGFFKQKTNDLISIDKCLSVEAPINAFIDRILKTQFTDVAPQKFKMAAQMVFTNESVPGSKSLLLTLFPDVTSPDNLKAFKQQLSSMPETLWVGLHTELDTAEPFPFETERGITYHALPNQFQQGNFASNKLLRQFVYDIVAPLKPKRVADLFCGSGNLSLQFANKDTYVEGIEFDKRAIYCAKHNVANNKIENAVYISGDTEAHVWKCAKKNEYFDVVITDPPRTGMYKTIIPLKKLSPETLIYVSCDPITMARDLGSLCRGEYEIADVTCFDFFPNTFHIETVTTLKKLKV